MRNITRFLCSACLWMAPAILFGADGKNSKEFQMLADLDAQVAFESSQLEVQQAKSLATIPAGVVALREPLPFSKPTDRVIVGMESDRTPVFGLLPLPSRPQPLPEETKPALR